MTLLKTRPTIQLLVPNTISPGRRLDVEVRLHAPEDVEVEHVHIDLRCRAGWSVPAGKTRVSRYDDLLGLRAIPFEGPTLTRGDHAFRASFDLPDGLPPSYASTLTSVRWFIDVEVSIPWWPDARSHHPLTVTLAEARGLVGEPARYRSQGAHGAPRIEASLTSSKLAPGGRIAGAVALHDFDPRSSFPIRIGLVERNTLYSAIAHERVLTARSWFIAAESPAGAHERGTPFEFGIPGYLQPDFRTAPLAHGHTLEIEVKTGRFSSTTLSIPVTIANDGALRDESLGLAVPSVGESRMAELGRAVADRRGYVIEGASLTRTIDAGDVSVAVQIGHEHRLREGAFLVASLTFPRLGLALSVEPQTGLAGYFVRDIEIDDPAWDREHRVTARDAQQASAFLRGLVRRLGKEGSFAELSDDSASLREPDSALSTESLDAFAAKVERVALALAEATRSVLPPTGLELAPEWAPLAARLGGRLVPGELAIDDAKLGGAEVRIETRWERPSHHIELRPDPPLPDAVSLALRAPQTEAATAPSLSPEVRALLARLPPDAEDLRLGNGFVSLELPFDRSGPTPRARPVDVSNVVDLLARLGPLFGVRRGPFR